MPVVGFLVVLFLAYVVIPLVKFIVEMWPFILGGVVLLIGWGIYKAFRDSPEDDKGNAWLNGGSIERVKQRNAASKQSSVHQWTNGKNSRASGLQTRASSIEKEDWRNFVLEANSTTIYAPPGVPTRGLVIMEEPLNKILAGRKTMELRSKPNRQLGRVALIKKGTGKIYAVAEIVESIGPMSFDELRAHAREHAVEPERLREVFENGWRYGWRLMNVVVLRSPVKYVHKGMSQVNLDPSAIEALGRELLASELETGEKKLEHVGQFARATTESNQKNPQPNLTTTTNRGEVKTMSTWNAETAAEGLLKRGYQCHYRKTKSANFRIDGTQLREISISLARKNGVTAYVNRLSTQGVAFPGQGLDGVEILERYPRGHVGVNGNPGIAGSVARNNHSLDPASNDVLRIEVRDDASLGRLLAWYAGK